MFAPDVPSEPLGRESEWGLQRWVCTHGDQGTICSLVAQREVSEGHRHWLAAGPRPLCPSWSSG